MAIDPIRSLFISVGVRDNGASAHMIRIGRQVDALSGKFIGLAQAALMAQKAMGMSGAMAGAGAVAGGRTAGGMASNGAPSSGRGRASSKSGGGMEGNRAFSRGSVGIGTATFVGLAGIGLGRAAVRSGSALEAASLRSQFAGGGSAAMLAAGSRARRRQFGGSLAQQTGLTQSIAQLGAGPGAIAPLASAASQFATLETDVSADDAAAGFFRLAKSTGFDLNRADEIASAIKRIGDMSAAGAGDVFEFTRELQSMGVLAGFDAQTIIALSGALSDLNPEHRAMFRGSMTRLFAKEFVDPKTINKLSGLMNLSPEEFTEMRRNDPSALLTNLFGAIAEIPKGERGEVLAGAGLDNIRDLTTLAIGTGSLDKFVGMLKAAREEMDGVGKTVMSAQFQEFKNTMEFMGKDLAGSFEDLGASISTSLAPAIKLVMSLMTGLAQGIAANPILSGLFGTAAAVGGVAIGKMFLRKQFGIGLSKAQGGAGPLGMMDGLLFASTFGRMGGKGRMAGALRGRARVGRAGILDAQLMGKVGKTGRMTGLGASLMGLLGGSRGGALVGKMAGKGIGRMALAGLGTGGIGTAVMLLGALAGPLTKISGALRGMGAQGGVAGAAAEGLALLFNVLRTGANLINFALDKLWQGIKTIASALGFNKFGDSAQGFLSSVNDGFDSFNSKIGGDTYNMTFGSDNSAKAYLEGANSRTVSIYGGIGGGL